MYTKSELIEALTDAGWVEVETAQIGRQFEVQGTDVTMACGCFVDFSATKPVFCSGGGLIAGGYEQPSAQQIAAHDCF